MITCPELLADARTQRETHDLDVVLVDAMRFPRIECASLAAAG
jgi:hypothetical protein